MKNESLLVLLLVVAALLSLGCADKKVTYEKIAEEMQEKQANVKDYSATIHSVLSFNGQLQEVKYEYIVKNPDKIKTIIFLPQEDEGTVTVSNGDKTWVYNPSANVVQVFDIPGVSSTAQTDYTNIIQHYMNDSEISDLGKDTFEGRNTSVINVHKKENRDDETLESDMTIWFDEETWLPLRIKVTGSLGGNEDYVYVVEYEDFKVNTGIGDEEFNYIIPDGAEVQLIDEYSDLFNRSQEQAQEEVNFTILKPEYIPAGYKLEKIYANMQFNDKQPETECVYMIYSGSQNDTISIYECSSDSRIKQDMTVYEGVKTVSIEGKEGTLSTFGDFKRLEWYTDNLYIMMDAAVNDTEMMKIASSMT